MYRFCIIVFLFFVSLCGIAQDTVNDYDVLSKLPSEQLMNDGRKYFEQRQAGKALSCFLVVSERYKENNNTTETEYSIRALNNCGCVYKYFYYDYIQAYEYLTRAYKLCESSGYDHFLPIILVNLGNLLDDYGSIYNSEIIKHQADSLFDESITKAFETKNWELLTTAFFNLSNHNYDLELTKYKAIFSEEIPDSTPDIHYVRLQYKGLQSMQQHKYAEAREFFEQQLTVVSDHWQGNYEALSTFINIAKTYKLEDNHTMAAENLEQALRISNEADIRDLSANICKQLTDCYQQMGDTDKQQYYHLLYLEKMEEMNNARLSNIAELKYIDELKEEEAKAQELALRHRLQQYIIVAIAIILLIVVASTVMIWRQNRLLQARNKSLFEKYQQLLRAESAQQEAKYSHSNLNDSQRETLIARIQEVLANPDIICQQDFTSKQLAELVGSNTTYVSQVINETYGVPFSTLLGNYRVKEACRRISEGNRYENLTIEGIANSVGFKSRTALLNAFKREVGLSPSEYLRMAATEKTKDTL